MDTAKLLNVISDLDNEEDASSINSQLQTLVSNINANQSAEIISNEKSIKALFENSRVNNYVPSNLEILHAIGADEYFGNNAFTKVSSILNSNAYNIPKTVKDLQDYIAKREKYVTVLKSTRENLQFLNFESYFPEGDNYQIGLLLPDGYTHNKIATVTKELNKWDKVIKTFKELVGEPAEDTEINFVSNGTLEFFINNSPAIGMALAFAVERIVKVYKNIVEIRQTRDKLKALGLPSSEQKTIEKQEKEHLSKELDKVSSELVKEFASNKIETGRLNELKIAIKGHVVYMAKCIDNGIIIEINPPEIEEPDETSAEATVAEKKEAKKAKVDYDKKLKEIEVVQKSMDVIKTVGKLGIDLSKLLSNGEDIVSDE